MERRMVVCGRREGGVARDPRLSVKYTDASSRVFAPALTPISVSQVSSGWPAIEVPGGPWW
jgi:hypothetical protein